MTPIKDPEKTTIDFSVSKAQREEISRIAEAEGISRAEFIRQAIELKLGSADSLLSELSEDELSEIKEYCQSNGIALKSFVRSALLKAIKPGQSRESLGIDEFKDLSFVELSSMDLRRTGFQELKVGKFVEEIIKYNKTQIEPGKTDDMILPVPTFVFRETGISYAAVQRWFEENSEYVQSEIKALGMQNCNERSHNKGKNAQLMFGSNFQSGVGRKSSKKQVE